jgi:hypothetical protein
MRKYTWLFTILLLLFVTPSIGHSQEIKKVTLPNKEVVIKIVYGKREGEFGRKDFSDGSSITPRAFTFDSDNNIYIADSVNNTPRVQVFDYKGKFLRTISLESRFKDPTVIDIVIKDGNLYVLLYRENIQVFTLVGKPNRTIEYYMAFDVKNKWTDALYDPSRMEIDSLGNIYLSSEAGALVKLDAQGKLLQKWAYVDHYIDKDNNLFVMELTKDRRGLIAKYASNGNKILEGKCEDLFPAPSSQSCRLPEFMDKEGRMYRRFRERFKGYHITRIMKFTKQESVLLETDLYADLISEYYKVDNNGNIYTIKDDLVKYSTSE